MSYLRNILNRDILIKVDIINQKKKYVRLENNVKEICGNIS